MLQSNEPHFARTPVLILLCAILTCATGCSGNGEVPLYPVEGKVIVDKVPLTAGIVGLIPDEEKGNTSKLQSWGNLDEKGIYTVSTKGRPGAPLGWYKVVVNVNTPPEDPRIPLPNAQYKTVATTDQRVEVTEEPMPGAYDFHLKH